MSDSIQQRLLEEFGGLFERRVGWEPTNSGDDSDLAGTLQGAVEEVDGIAAGLSAAAGQDGAVESGASSTGSADVTEALDETIRVLTQMAPHTTLNATATTAGSNIHSEKADAGSDTSSGTSIGSIATTFLESGFGIVPLISGLIGLFSGGAEAPPALEKYVMPGAISFESAETANGLAATDFDQTGAPRVYSAGAAIPVEPAADHPSTPGAPGAAGGTTAPQITVNVQAIDAQSFMDYSSQIAQAVRSAMLNLSSLNDVVSEL